ncbi:hypothetical protein OPT61_g9299 [Boeremia exigua]|uniref:Uncharacterized protein n=1 Tax=Boeremia exigua TaxID=749465 RepID=A0ACC2HUP2_9PLEO|nr:hypothetical protein OPT61_g9299 [Boeremia exigua]
MYSTRSFIITGLVVPWPFAASIPLAAVPLETAPDLPYTWDYKGCFIDRVGNRALKRAATSDHEMTGGLCSRWCAEQGYNLAGTEWGREVPIPHHYHLHHTHPPSATAATPSTSPSPPATQTAPCPAAASQAKPAAAPSASPSTRPFRETRPRLTRASLGFPRWGATATLRRRARLR